MNWMDGDFDENKFVSDDFSRFAYEHNLDEHEQEHFIADIQDVWQAPSDDREVSELVYEELTRYWELHTNADRDEP
jgi:hypothetical protein